jgi:hypothetical protein
MPDESSPYPGAGQSCFFGVAFFVSRFFGISVIGLWLGYPRPAQRRNEAFRRLFWTKSVRFPSSRPYSTLFFDETVS